MDRVRIGILGAARIAPMALIGPAKHVDEAEVVAVAARDKGRAQKFASKHGIATVHDSYDALLADPEVDAVYVPLPNGLHREWVAKALAAGKHVLCEKPFTANAAEAEELAGLAASGDRVVMEAFHWRYHPLAARVLDLIAEGAVGELRHVETWMCIPLPLPGDIRYRYELAGGATMDVGCYAIHMLRTFAGQEPIVRNTEFALSRPNVDRYMSADFDFPGGATGRMNCSLMSARLLRVGAHIRGERGEIRVLNPVAPHFYHRLRWVGPDGATTEKVAGEATYTHQLRAFAAAVLGGAPTLTPPAESVANMRVIDAVYDHAGLPRRGTSV